MAHNIESPLPTLESFEFESLLRIRSLAERASFGREGFDGILLQVHVQSG
jgi:hypothetical protein